MNFINRAIKNVTRKVSKSVLLIITFFVIGNFVIIGLGVSNASESAKILTRQKMRAVVNYTVDYDKYYYDAEQITDEEEREEFYNNWPKITYADVQNVLKDERVKAANATSVSMHYLGEGLDFVHLGNDVEQSMEENNTSCWIEDGGKEVCETYRNPDMTIKSNFFPNMIQIVDGDWEIVDGRFYSQEEIDNHSKVGLVTEAFAEHNGLKVGDTVNYFVENIGSYYQQMGITEDDVKESFEIIGIYRHNNPITPDSENFGWTYPYENPDNVFLLPATTALTNQLKLEIVYWDYWAKEYPEDEYYSNPDNKPTLESYMESSLNDVTLLLNDPLDVDKFVEDYKGNLGNYQKLDANNEEFNTLSKPLDTLSMYANFIVWLVVINAIVIITLVTALTLKTREYEIGVLLSIGASKLKVIGQFFVELALVAIIGFSLSVASGSMIAKKIGNTVLEYQIASSGLNEEDEYSWDRDYYSIWDDNLTTEVTLEDLIAEYEVNISPVIIGEIYVMGLGIVLISVIIPSFMIMRFNPKKILMNQN